VSSPDSDLRSAARLLSAGACDWSQFLSWLTPGSRLDLLRALAVGAKAVEVRAYVESLDARRNATARTASTMATSKTWLRARRRRRRNRRGRTEPLYDTEPLPVTQAGLGGRLDQVLQALAPAGAAFVANALLGRIMASSGGGFVTRTREDYERGMACDGGCGKTIKLGGETQSMTCMLCGGEVCNDCSAEHELKCKPGGAP